jgi:hypothetical protein
MLIGRIGMISREQQNPSIKSLTIRLANLDSRPPMQADQVDRARRGSLIRIRSAAAFGLSTAR